ncbi:MAG: hypothetical protein ACWGQW_15130 [bacterium]
MRTNNLITLIGVGILTLLLTASLSAQRPAEPQAGPHARAVLAPSGGSPSDPEQEAADEMNRILRSLRIIQRFFDLPEEVLQEIVADTYEEMLELLRCKHELVVELNEWMNGPNPPPGQIGELIIEIRELSLEIKAISESWGHKIEAVLDEEQLEKLEMVRRVSGLIPAFKQVGLIPPPPPRVRPTDAE